MKNTLLASLAVFFMTPLIAKAQVQESDAHVLSPEAEELVYRNYFSPSFRMMKSSDRFRFEQTSWDECKESITGNYTGYACARQRGISVILKSFINDHIYQCVNEGLAAQGGGKAADLHIVHAGILADREHSPRSLHAESRAIDIRSIEVKLTSGLAKTLVYEGTTNRRFYKAFRKCWGNAVHTYNGCPFYAGNPALTATIGWENRNHQHHLHTSIPYCVNGKYSSLYYKK